jgi:hypothetical protein
MYRYDDLFWLEQAAELVWSIIFGAYDFVAHGLD